MYILVKRPIYIGPLIVPTALLAHVYHPLILTLLHDLMYHTCFSMATLLSAGLPPIILSH
jgi:hypothetical protein